VGGLAAYAAVLILAEPLMWVFNGWHVVCSVAALTPPLLGAVLFAGLGWRTAAVGSVLLFYGGVASLAYNVRHVQSGVWFIHGWIS
jgi:hypothetical protein